MQSPKQNNRAPQTHRSALAVPSYHRILVKHGLIEKILPIPMRIKCFRKWALTEKYKNSVAKVAHGNRIKHVPALYLATAMALQGMTEQELDAPKLRIEKKRV